MAADKISQTVRSRSSSTSPSSPRSTASRRAPMVAPSSSRRPSGCTASSRRLPGSRRQARAGEDSAHARGADRTADLRPRAVIPTATTRPLGGGSHPQLLLGRDPVAGAPLASQPTISRFENGPGRGALYRMARELAACVIEPASTPPAAAGVAGHHRSGPDRRPDAWRATTDVLQRALRQLVLSAAARVPDFQRREGAVICARRCCGRARRWRPTGP